jgi:predicted short-subunit dehydrogenase-like oxidoreductase (DUF2520 family)
MKRAQSVGLIGTGSLTDTPLTRFWFLPERLGPVKSTSLRVASRVCNMLRGGHPVKDYSEFQDCELILVYVPDEAAPKIVSELASTGITWRNKAVVLCSTWLSSDELLALSDLGAAIGSLSTIPGFDDERYLVEGDSLAIRLCKSLVEGRDRRVVAVERPLKPFYLAGLTCTGSLLFALVHVAYESMLQAGITPAFLGPILERQMTRTLRSYLKGFLRAYPELRELPKQLNALSGADPNLAQYLEQGAHLASRTVAKRFVAKR